MSHLSLRKFSSFKMTIVGAVCLFIANLVILLWPAHDSAMYCGLLLLGISYGITSSALWGAMGIYSAPESLGLLYAIPYCAFNVGAFAFNLVTGSLLGCLWCTLTFWCCVSGLSVGVAVLWLLAERSAALHPISAAAGLHCHSTATTAATQANRVQDRRSSTSTSMSE
jgi:hypothetical protein